MFQCNIQFLFVLPNSRLFAELLAPVQCLTAELVLERRFLSRNESLREQWVPSVNSDGFLEAICLQRLQMTLGKPRRNKQ